MMLNNSTAPMSLTEKKLYARMLSGIARTPTRSSPSKFLGELEFEDNPWIEVVEYGKSLHSISKRSKALLSRLERLFRNKPFALSKTRNRKQP
jgi:hypothetical protein